MSPINNLLLYFCSLLFIQCNSSSIDNNTSNPYLDDYSKIATLSQRNLWNGANVHDPTCIKVNDTYYLYSTDAYYMPANAIFKNDTTIQLGHIPYRSSKDLLHWKFEGWVFDSIPNLEYSYLNSENNGIPPSGIWSPFIHKKDNEFRLYYSVSYYGTNISCIALATSTSPKGPWKQKGIVVKTNVNDKMNAVDPAVIEDHKNNKDWLIYGSYFDGLYCVELNTKNGLTAMQDDKGTCIARRAEMKTKNIGASDIIYNKSTDMYYLFLSYDPIFSFYNIRVGRSKNPNGPYLDFNGNDLRDTTNNYPILTSSYIFENHPGWSGNASCCVIKDDNKYYMLHQSRLAPDNNMIQLHTRELKWLANGWPVVSPERYLPFTSNTSFNAKDLLGNWEIIEMNELADNTQLWKGQVPAGGWKYKNSVYNSSSIYSFNYNQTVDYPDSSIQRSIYSYNFLNDETIELTDTAKNAFQCKIFQGWDWENHRQTLLFSGINNKGITVWGKKVND